MGAPKMQDQQKMQNPPAVTLPQQTKGVLIIAYTADKVGQNC